MKRFALVLALAATAGCSKPAGQAAQQSQMSDTSHMMMSDTSKMMMSDTAQHMMMGDTSKKMAQPPAKRP